MPIDRRLCSTCHHWLAEHGTIRVPMGGNHVEEWRWCDVNGSPSMEDGDDWCSEWRARDAAIPTTQG